MSWSFQATGKSPAVRQEIARQGANGRCSEPEESLRQQALQIIDLALCAQNDNQAVRVEASGNQTYKDWTNKTGLSNQLKVSVEPLYGWVE